MISSDTFADMPRISIAFRVIGSPIPQPRVRVAARGGFARAYVPAKHPVNAWRRLVEISAKPFIAQPIDEPLRVKILFEIERPKSHYRTGRFAAELRANAPTHVSAAPDVDNLAKAVLDALNDCGFWRDDSLVVHLEAAKVWAVEEPGACIFIESIT